VGEECCKNNEHKEEDCCGGHEDKECGCHDQPSIEEIAFSAHYKIDALIGLLIKKGVLTEEELQKEIEALYDKLEKEPSEEK